MNKINNQMKNVNTKEDFLKLLAILIDDLKSNVWDNNTLESYLSGVEGWVDDMDGYFANIKDDKTLEKLNNNELDWKILAHIFVASTVYE